MKYTGKETMITITAVAAVLGVVAAGVIRRRGIEGAMPAIITVAVFAVVIFAVFLVMAVVIYAKLGKARKVFREKGVCREYAEELLRIKNPTYFQQIAAADAYASIGDYRESEHILDILPGEMAFNSREKALYYKTYILVFTRTGRYRQAIDLFNGCSGFLDGYYAAHRTSATAYYDDAALVCAVMRDFKRADHYRGLCEGVCDHSPYTRYAPHMIMAELFIIDGQTENARVQAETAHNIADNTPVKYPWMKQQLHKTIDEGLQTAERIRADCRGDSQH